MAMPEKLLVIDADAHVIETERTWDYLDPSERKFRPLLYSSPDDPAQQYWVFDEKIRGFRFPSLDEQQLWEISQRSGRNVETPRASRELDDVELRLKHMDQLGIDIQVVHNTLWIEQVTERPEAEVALCWSWNRWLGEIWKKGRGRIRWSCVIPTIVINEAIAQMKMARENGAVAVCMRPLEGNRHLTDPYFYPIYEAATELDMAIAVHIANGNPDNCDLYRLAPAGRMAQFRAPTVIACFNHLMSELPRLFPQLRWGFIEASAQWISWVYKEAAIRYKRAGRTFPDDIFGEYRVFVTCQTNDDIPYILQYAGERSLVIGTDYGHTDPSSEVDAITEFKSQKGISREIKEKIVCHNPKALYAL
jgi:predicted TIM-barrel fold metal-dependent hydrolase